MKRPLRTGLVTGSAALATAAVAAAALGIGGGTETPQGNTPQQATTPVTRTTLVQSEEVNGTLGYGPPTPVSTATGAVLTWLPAPGATISRGRAVYRADNLPVVLFYGTLPLYRPLHVGDTGADVKEIERNLAALGYSGITVDTRYTAATAAAVKKWQKALGLSRTGVLDPATVVVAPGAIRIAAVQAHPGDHANGPVLSYNGTTRVVSVSLDVALQNLVKTGNPAKITLPGGQLVDGVLATVGTVATPGADANHPATIALTVTVADQSKLGGLDEAPVVVSITSAKAENVLTVPVAALVALAEGGYGVQIVDTAGSHYVSVRLGMFADGRVEITGDGLSEQTQVGVPS
ncbi:peptidoglycan-binding domain-containing protein [Hamadaea sp. NPDC051192]|uniref:peptidoglycan-binding domain-containing protein n=1 Tax=Hamadaea sp. NPDC051192 TaxID=3154940 RepID=UPI00341BB489